VRQLLADKVSGSLVGLWLLIPEHLRLGTYDLLCGWSGHGPDEVEPRLAMQMIHEAALCSTNLREQRCLSQKGFELANGLPFVASDTALHALGEAHTMAEAQALQRAWGKLRRASGHFPGSLIVIDPHRLTSYSQRQMTRHKDKEASPARKVAQTFFCLDAQSAQPICLTTGSSSRTVAQVTPELLDLAGDILSPQGPRPLVLADTEHWSADLFKSIVTDSRFDLLVPMPHQPVYQRAFRALASSAFTPRWVGYATAQRPFHFAGAPDVPLVQFIQRSGEAPGSYTFKGFLSTRPRDELDLLSNAYPQRWHIEEFFHTSQDLGWKRAGTLNLHIRHAQMTFALMAQGVLYQLRRRLGPPWATYEAWPFAQKILRGLDGDVRVVRDTILVTYYNAPHAALWRAHFEHLPEQLAQEGISPHIPWLYGFKLDFRFK